MYVCYYFLYKRMIQACEQKNETFVERPILQPAIKIRKGEIAIFWRVCITHSSVWLMYSYFFLVAVIRVYFVWTFPENSCKNLWMFLEGGSRVFHDASNVLFYFCVLGIFAFYLFSCCIHLFFYVSLFTICLEKVDTMSCCEYLLQIVVRCYISVLRNCHVVISLSFVLCSSFQKCAVE